MTDSSDLAMCLLSLGTQPEYSSGICDKAPNATLLNSSHRPARRIWSVRSSKRDRRPRVFYPTEISLTTQKIPRPIVLQVELHGLLMPKEILDEVLKQTLKHDRRKRPLFEARRAVLLQTPAVIRPGSEEKCWLARGVVIFKPSEHKSTHHPVEFEPPDRRKSKTADLAPYIWPIQEIGEINPAIFIPRRFGPVVWIKLSREQIADIGRSLARSKAK